MKDTTIASSIPFTGEVGLLAAPIVADGVSSAPRICLAALQRPKKNPKDTSVGFDARTGKRLWIFHTIPQARRARSRYLAERLVAIHRQHRRVGAGFR